MPETDIFIEISKLQNFTITILLVSENNKYMIDLNLKL